jgi:hypothetical protein
VIERNGRIGTSQDGGSKHQYYGEREIHQKVHSLSCSVRLAPKMGFTRSNKIKLTKNYVAAKDAIRARTSCLYDLHHRHTFSGILPTFRQQWLRLYAPIQVGFVGRNLSTHGM